LINEEKTTAQGDALITLLKSSLSTDGAQSFGHIVLYTTFGVIRGRIGFNFAQELSGHTDVTGGSIKSLHQIVELDDVSVEHYSNHLPTASFERLYIRLVDIQAFALLKT
jgi:thiamine monophosphate kinase